MSASKQTAIGFPQWTTDDNPEMKDYNDAFVLLDSLIQEQGKKIAALEFALQEQQ